MSRGGFDPGRMDQEKRAQPVVPQILSSDTPHLAKGFTEIKVVGIGGAGGNTINRMIETGVQGIDFVAVNTDAQALEQSLATTRIQLGSRLTHGLGAGGDPKIGERAAEAARDDIREVLSGSDMVFVTAGLGGGTGTGAIPEIAEIARQSGALTVGVVTLPFSFEGSRRRAISHAGLDKLSPHLDSIITVSNDRLMGTSKEALGIRQAFKLADETLNQGIHGIADLILTPGLINLDFADVNTVMQRSGPAHMAIGVAAGEDRAVTAAERALHSSLMDASIEGARGVLLNITGGPDLTLYEVNQAADLVSMSAAADANIIFGAVVHPRIKDEVRITVIATGFRRT